MLEWLRTFRLVARHASFTRAAQEAGLTRSAVSQQIKLLEQHFGVSLFERNTRQVLLTDAGRVLLDHADRLLAIYHELDSAMAAVRGGDRNVLTIGASTLPGETLLPPALVAFRRTHPTVEIQVREANSEAVLQMVRNGEVMMGLVGSAVDDPALICRRVAEDEIVLVVPDEVALPDPLPVSMLGQLPLVLREPGSATRAAVLAALQGEGIGLDGLKVIAEMGSPEAVKAAVKARVGAAFLSRSGVNPQEFHTVRVAGLNLRREVSACWRKDHPPTDAAEFLLAHLAGEPI